MGMHDMISKPVWDPDTGRHRTLPTLNWQIAGMAFWTLTLIGNLIGFLNNLGDNAALMTLNLFMIPACLFFLNGAHSAYKTQIENRAQWRKLKYEAFLGRPWDLPENEDWPAIERAIEDMVKRDGDPNLFDARQMVKRQQEREAKAKLGPCAHENVDLVYRMGYSEPVRLCMDCGENRPRP